MELNGRTVKFRRTIWATNAVMKMCPDGNLERISEVFNGDAADNILSMSAFITIMSEGYEQAMEFEASRRGETYKKDPVTMDELMTLTDYEAFEQLSKEALDAWTNDGKPTVESEPPKGKKTRKNAVRK